MLDSCSDGSVLLKAISIECKSNPYPGEMSRDNQQGGSHHVAGNHLVEGTHPVEGTHAVAGMPRVLGGKPLVEEDMPQGEAGTPQVVVGSLAEGIPDAGTHGHRQHHALCLRRAPCHPRHACPCRLPLLPQATERRRELRRSANQVPDLGDVSVGDA